MNEVTSYNDCLKVILDKMFSYSPFKYSEGFVSDDGWYLKHAWNLHDQQEFEDWLFNYLCNDKNARRYMISGFVTKPKCKKSAHEFVCDFGWSVKD